MNDKQPNKGGRPSHKPTDATRKQVETLAGFGITEDDIAMSLEISKPTLIKHYRRELDMGHIKANSAVAQSLYKKATGEGASAVTAAIFWLKTRAGWKETVVNEHSGPDGGPIEMREVSDLDRAKAMAFLASKAKREVSGKA